MSESKRGSKRGPEIQAENLQTAEKQAAEAAAEAAEAAAAEAAVAEAAAEAVEAEAEAAAKRGEVAAVQRALYLRIKAKRNELYELYNLHELRLKSILEYIGPHGIFLEKVKQDVTELNNWVNENIILMKNTIIPSVNLSVKQKLDEAPAIDQYNIRQNMVRKLSEATEPINREKEGFIRLSIKMLMEPVVDDPILDDIVLTAGEEQYIRYSIREKVSASPVLQILGYFNKFSKMLEDLITYKTYATPQVESQVVEPQVEPSIQLSDPPPSDISDISNTDIMVLYCYLHGGKAILNKTYSNFIVMKDDMEVFLITNAIRGEVTLAVRSTRYLSYYEMAGLGEGINGERINRGYQNYRRYGSFNDFHKNVNEDKQTITYKKPYTYKYVIPSPPYPHRHSDTDLLFVYYIISTFRSIIHKIFPIQDPSPLPAILNARVDEYISKNLYVKDKPSMIQFLTAVRSRGHESSRLTAVNTNRRYWLGPDRPIVPTDLTQPEYNYGAFPVIIKNILNVKPGNVKNVKNVKTINNDETYNQKPSFSLRNKGFQTDYPYNDKSFRSNYKLILGKIANRRQIAEHIQVVKGCYFPATPFFEYNARGRIGAPINGIPGMLNPDDLPKISFDIRNPNNVYNTAIMILMLNDYLEHEQITNADLGFTFPNGGNFYSPRDICVVYDIKFTIPQKINGFTNAVFEQRHVVIRAGETFLANPHVVEYFIKIYDCLIILRPIYYKEKCINDDGGKHYDVGGKYRDAPHPTNPQEIPLIQEGSDNYVYKVYLQDATLLQIIRFCEHAGITKFIMDDNSCDTLSVEDDNKITQMETEILTRTITGQGGTQHELEIYNALLLGIETIPESAVSTPRTASPPSSPRSPGGGASRHRFIHHTLSTGKNIIMNANKIMNMNVGKNMLVKSVGKTNIINKSHRRNSYRYSNHNTSVKAASYTSKLAKRTRRQPRRKTRKV